MVHSDAQRHQLHLRVVLSLFFLFVLFCCVLEGGIKDLGETADRVDLRSLLVKQLAGTPFLNSLRFLFSLIAPLNTLSLIVIQVQKDFSLIYAFAIYRFLVHYNFDLATDNYNIQINPTNVEDQVELYKALTWDTFLLR